MERPEGEQSSLIPWPGGGFWVSLTPLLLHLEFDSVPLRSVKMLRSLLGAEY